MSEQHRPYESDTPADDPWAAIRDALHDPATGGSDPDIQALFERGRMIEVDSNGPFCARLDVLKRSGIDFPDEPDVLYPGSAAHIDVADMLGERTMHVDVDASRMDIMRRHGYRTTTSSIEDFAAATPPDSYDILVSNNAGTLDDASVALLRPGGFIIANNWHGAANNLSVRPDMELRGAAAITNERSSHFLDPDEAKDTLGTIVKAEVSHGVFAEIDPADAADYATTFEEHKSPDDLFVFQKLD